MHPNAETTFARYPSTPLRTDGETLVRLYLTHATNRPQFDLCELARLLVAIDLRRFDMHTLGAALDGYRLSSSWQPLRAQLESLLEELLDAYGDPTLWEIDLDQLPPFVTGVPAGDPTHPLWPGIPVDEFESDRECRESPVDPVWMGDFDVCCPECGEPDQTLASPSAVSCDACGYRSELP
jgi:hypothetical protein